VLGSFPVIAFVATADPGRAKAFYAGTLGLRLTGEDPFALVFDAGGTSGREHALVDRVPRIIGF